MRTWYIGFNYQVKGDSRRAIDCLQQTLTSLDVAQRLEHFGQFILPAVNARAWLAFCYAEQGGFAEGQVLGQEGQKIAEEANRPPSLILASWGLGLLHLRQGDLPRSLSQFEQAMDLCQKEEGAPAFLWVALSLCETYALAGNTADAMQLVTQVIQYASTDETVDFQTLSFLSLGRTYVAAG